MKILSGICGEIKKGESDNNHQILAVLYIFTFGIRKDELANFLEGLERLKMLMENQH